jgi:hypothetical protein
MRVVSTQAAKVTSIADVAGDQGGQARLTFSRSPFDYVGSGSPITGYQVYRRSIIASAAHAAQPESQAQRTAHPAAIQLLGWDYVMTVPTANEDFYQIVVPTLADSNGSGFHRAVLFVRATTAAPGTFYDSPADSGYSVDNLPPAPPVQLVATYQSGATQLHWARNTEHDLWYYKVYRGTDASFTPGPGNLIASLPDTGYVDAGAAGSSYKLSAVDVNGNESGYALVQGPGTTGVEPGQASIFALEAVRPNPARAAHLMLSFSLPSAAPAKLEVFEVNGRRVTAQDVGALGAGRHSVSFANARLVAGVYLVRLTQGNASMTRRVAIVE